MCFGCGADARVWFIEPADGAEVTSPFTIKFGVEGMNLVKAADQSPDDETSGHHHLLVNSGAVALGTIIEPDDEGKSRFHYGLAQEEVEFELPAGEHKLTMQFGDWEHRSYGPPMSATITVTVK